MNNVTINKIIVFSLFAFSLLVGWAHFSLASPQITIIEDPSNSCQAGFLSRVQELEVDLDDQILDAKQGNSETSPPKGLLTTQKNVIGFLYQLFNVSEKVRPILSKPAAEQSTEERDRFTTISFPLSSMTIVNGLNEQKTYSGILNLPVPNRRYQIGNQVQFHLVLDNKEQESFRMGWRIERHLSFNETTTYFDLENLLFRNSEQIHLSFTPDFRESLKNIIDFILLFDCDDPEGKEFNRNRALNNPAAYHI